MNWRKVDAYCIRSEDPSGYQIARVSTKDGDRFDLWRGRMHVNTYVNAADARVAAVLHAERFDAGQPA